MTTGCDTCILGHCSLCILNRIISKHYAQICYITNTLQFILCSYLKPSISSIRSGGIAQNIFSLCFILNATSVRHPLPPILSRLRHPRPLLMLHVNTHKKGLSKGDTTCIAHGRLPKKVILQSDTYSKVTVSGGCS